MFDWVPNPPLKFTEEREKMKLFPFPTLDISINQSSTKWMFIMITINEELYIFSKLLCNIFWRYIYISKIYSKDGAII